MRSNNRESILKLAVGVVIGLFLFDRFILTPAIDHWKAQGETIADLRAKVQRGHQLIEREQTLRAKWDDMVHSDLPEDISSAENEVFKGMGRWAVESRINFSSLTPQWHSHSEGYDTFECRATATGDQAALGRMIYELETDPLPARLEELELSSRDPKGQQLNLTMKFTFIHFTDVAKGFR